MNTERTAPGRTKRSIQVRPSWVPSILQERSLPLLVSLLALLAVTPWLDEQLVGSIVLELLFTLVMLGAIRRLSVDRGQALFGVLLALPTMACLWIREFVPIGGLSQAGLALLTLLLLYTGATVLLHVFREDIVTFDTLIGAFSVYLLMGLAWSGIDSLLYLQGPGAFHLPDGWRPTHESGITVDVPFNILLYFSFITLTTVGYGDVLPVSGAARTVAILEAVLGHFYLAVLVARLVGLHIADVRRRGSA